MPQFPSRKAEVVQKLYTVNPYRRRVAEFPGRLFTELDDAAFAAVRQICASAPRIICELGSGSGGHLLARAALDPQAAFIGFELRYKRSVRTIEKALGAGIENVYVLRTNALEADKLFETGSLSALYVNFPDPWSKLRQKKRRLLSPWLIALARDKLRPGGMLSIKTDHSDNFLEFRSLCREAADFELLRETEDLHNDAELLRDNVASEFEKLFRDQKTPIYHLVLRKRD